MQAKRFIDSKLSIPYLQIVGNEYTARTQ